MTTTDGTTPDGARRRHHPPTTPPATGARRRRHRLAHNEVVAAEVKEREDKYDVDPRFVLPDLVAMLPDGARLDTRRFDLISTYYDTATADLRHNRLTLRRREGDTDIGWHLKLPASKATDGARIEVRTGDGPELPAELSDALLGVRRGQPLAAVARLATRRVAHCVLDAEGQLLAEIADDTVDATDISAGPGHGGSVTAQTWREVEVEAGPGGDEDLLATLGAALVAAGAQPSAFASKLVRAMGPVAQRPPIEEDSTLADLVSDYLATQCTAIVAGDLGLRLGHDVIHPTRVAIRRLRSTLRTFAPLIDAPESAALEGELVWFAGLLGGVRDADVLRVRLDRLVAELPDELVLGPVATRIDNELRAERAERLRAVAQTLNSARLMTLLESVQRWRLAPPLTAAAEAPAGKVAKFLRRSRRKLHRRLRAASRATQGQEQLVHRARKAGKRFRYAAELASPTLGDRATEQAREAEALQDLLGEHQDSVVSAAALRRFGASAGTTQGENGFTFGILLEAELRRGAEIRAEITRRDG